MKPLDVIREKIDSDLIKYHASNLCKIDSDKDVYNLTGVGVCALVRLISIDESNLPADPTKTLYFPVLIINRPYGWIDSNVSKKYYVLILSTVEDRASSFSVGFLVSQSAVTDIEDFRSKRLKQKTDEKNYKEASIAYLKSKQETNQLGIK